MKYIPAVGILSSSYHIIICIVIDDQNKSDSVSSREWSQLNIMMFLWYLDSGRPRSLSTSLRVTDAFFIHAGSDVDELDLGASDLLST